MPSALWRLWRSVLRRTLAFEEVFLMGSVKFVKSEGYAEYADCTRELSHYRADKFYCYAAAAATRTAGTTSASWRRSSSSHRPTMPWLTRWLESGDHCLPRSNNRMPSMRTMDGTQFLLVDVKVYCKFSNRKQLWSPAITDLFDWGALPEVHVVLSEACWKIYLFLLLLL